MQQEQLTRALLVLPTGAELGLGATAASWTLVKSLSPPGTTEVWYEDEEGDKIMVNSDQGLEEGVRWAASEGQTLRLCVDPPPSSLGDDETDSLDGWLDVPGPSEVHSTTSASPEPEAQEALVPEVVWSPEVVATTLPEEPEEPLVWTPEEEAVYPVLPPVWTQEVAPPPSVTWSLEEPGHQGPVIMNDKVVPFVEEELETKTAHPGVVCDACEGEIVGVRYKSAVVPNFDLCEGCEDCDKAWQEGHGPFLKLYSPSQVPGVILCAPQSGPAWTLEEHLALLGQPQLAQDFAEFLAFRKTTREAVPKSCTHALAPFSVPPGAQKYACDGCQAKMAPGQALYGCRECNFDLCLGCHSPPAEDKMPSLVPKSAKKALPPPQARFVCDVTLADGSVVYPGQQLDKTWRVRNTGEGAWPKGTKICHVGGDTLSGPLFGQEVSCALPNESVNISVDLVMPTQPGRYTSYWRLVSPLPQSARFGHRFWITVNVVAPPAAPVYLAPPTRAAATTPIWQGGLELAVSQLVEFGFTDVERIKRVLEMVDGDTGRAIDRLLEEE